MSEIIEANLASLVAASRPITYGIVQPGPDVSPDGIPLIRGKDYSSGRVSESNLYHVSPAIDRPYARSKVQGGDILFSIVGYVGLVAEVPNSLVGANITQTTARISVDGTRVDGKYLFYCLSSPYYRPQITRYEKGSAQPGLNLSDVARLKVRVPNLSTQRQVAEILVTVDEAIDQTEALIAKSQQIKSGLMHDLFTRGVLPNGELRPLRSAAPQLYKESPVGWIPKEWSCERVNDLLAQTACPMRSGPFGSALLKEELVEDGVPLLGIDNIFAENFSATYTRFVSPEKFRSLRRYAVSPRDVIITIMGTVGRCCVAPDDIGLALSSKHLWTMTFDAERVLPELVCWQLSASRWVKSWFARYAQGAIMEAIQSSTLRLLPLPVPAMDEQVRIFDRYEILSHELTAEREHLTKLQHLKRGLMHDLLTGRVRVPASLLEGASRV